MSKRSYGDPCGIARALDVVGERWALLVVRELLLGPKRFSDLRAGLPHVGPDVLAQRLRDLEAAGVLRRRRLPPPVSAQVYELTPRGQELEPVIVSLGRWGSTADFPATPGELSPDALVIALKTVFDPRAAGEGASTYELRLGDDRFTVRIAAGELTAARGEMPDADAVIEATPGTLARLLWHGGDPAAAERASELALAGSRGAVKRFLRAFPLPEAA